MQPAGTPPARTPTDAPVALLARIAQGDREAFGRFYDAFARLALGTVKTRARLGLERLRSLMTGGGKAEP